MMHKNAQINKKQHETMQFFIFSDFLEFTFEVRNIVSLFSIVLVIGGINKLPLIFGFFFRSGKDIIVHL